MSYHPKGCCIVVLANADMVILAQVICSKEGTLASNWAANGTLCVLALQVACSIHKLFMIALRGQQEDTAQAHKCPGHLCGSPAHLRELAAIYAAPIAAHWLAGCAVLPTSV